MLAFREEVMAFQLFFINLTTNIFHLFSVHGLLGTPGCPVELVARLGLVQIL